MLNNYNELFTGNETIDFETSGHVMIPSNMQIISEVGGMTDRSSSMENVLDSYIQKRAIPLVLRKRLMYEQYMARAQQNLAF